MNIFIYLKIQFYKNLLNSLLIQEFLLRVEYRWKHWWRDNYVLTIEITDLLRKEVDLPMSFTAHPERKHTSNVTLCNYVTIRDCKYHLEENPSVIRDKDMENGFSQTYLPWITSKATSARYRLFLLTRRVKKSFAEASCCRAT